MQHEEQPGSRRFDPSATMVYRAYTESEKQPVPDDVWHMSVEVIGGPMDGQRSRVPKPVYFQS